MKIHRKPVGSHKIIIVAIVLIILFIFSIYLTVNTKSIPNSSQNEIVEKPTRFLENYGLEEMIRQGINVIHKDSICTIYLNKSLGNPSIYYVYRDSLNEDQLEDRFFVHFYLKSKSEFINMDFYHQPRKLVTSHAKYFVFQRDLGYDRINLDSVAHLNTGRFGGKGKSYSIKNINIGNVIPVNISNSLDNIILSLKHKAYLKIKRKRDEALKAGILSTSELDFVKVKLSSQQKQNIKGDIRLKGDWTDHLIDSIKWSFRIKLAKDETSYRMRKFSIQHPKTRNYAWEWLLYQSLSQNDLISLRYNFVNVELQIEKKDSILSYNMGIMAIEESFDKILIENNKRREGVIISFDESLLWEDRKKFIELGFKGSENRDVGLQSVNNAPIKVFNENKVLSSPNLTAQFKSAKNLLFSLRKGDLLISEVFDIDKLTLFVAITNLFGGHHGLIWHNLRMYYNPVTNKLEPISYDSNAGHKISEIKDYMFSENDPLYQKKLFEKLKLVSSSSFLKKLFDANYVELSNIILNLLSEYDVFLDRKILEYNSNYIKKQLSPSHAIVSHLESYDATTMTVGVKNVSNFPIVIHALESDKRKLLTNYNGNEIIYPNQKESIIFPLKNAFVNAFVSKKNKKGNFQYPKDVSRIRLSYNIIGSNNRKIDRIIPFRTNDMEYLDYHKEFLTSDFYSTEFIQVNEKEKTINFKTGDYILNNTLKIPAGFKVTVEKGFKLNLINNASLLVYSPIFCEGTKKLPINFYSSDSTGRGILVSNTSTKSLLNYCHFTNLSNPKNTIWSLTGAVNFNEANVSIKNSIFANNRSEDALNIIRSDFNLDSVHFKNTKSDAFDGDFVNGSIMNSSFINCGNDGIDVSGSNLMIKNVKVTNSSDKAISAGEGSMLYGKGVQIIGGEIGIVSKDLSSIELQSVSIKNTRLALSSFQKKSEFGPSGINILGSLLSNNELDYLVEQKSKLSINNVYVQYKVNNVINKMYGKEYGKSSK